MLHRCGDDQLNAMADADNEHPRVVAERALATLQRLRCTTGGGTLSEIKTLHHEVLRCAARHGSDDAHDASLAIGRVGQQLDGTAEDERDDASVWDTAIDAMKRWLRHLDRWPLDRP
jgi:hypothetical protein